MERPRGRGANETLPSGPQRPPHYPLYARSAEATSHAALLSSASSSTANKPTSKRPSLSWSYRHFLVRANPGACTDPRKLKSGQNPTSVQASAGCEGPLEMFPAAFQFLIANWLN